MMMIHGSEFWHSIFLLQIVVFVSCVACCLVWNTHIPTTIDCNTFYSMTSSSIVAVQAFSSLSLPPPKLPTFHVHAAPRPRFLPSLATRAATTTESSSSSSLIEYNESKNNTNKLFIFGLGRVGQQVVQQSLRSCDSSNIGTSNHHQHNCSTNNTTSNTKFFASICGTVRNVTLMLDDSDSNNNTTAIHKTENRNSILEPDDDGATAIRTIPFSHDNPNTDIIFNEIRNGTTHILITIPPNSDPIINDSLNQFYDQLIDTILVYNKNRNDRYNDCASSVCEWIGIVSTTGVYGNQNGNYVTEETECNVTASSSASQLLYLTYEAQWKQRIQRRRTVHTPTKNHTLSHNTGNHLTLCIFRCAGIYSNDQSALHAVYKKGYNNQMLPTLTSMATTVSSNEADNNNRNGKGVNIQYDDVTNRIHVYDVAASIFAAMTQQQVSKEHTDINHSNVSVAETTAATIQVYNIADDLPESRTVVMQYATQLLLSLSSKNTTNGHGNILSTGPNSNVRLSSDITTSGTGIANRTRDQRRRTDQKRINNTKMKQALIQQLKYPTYKEGLDDILQYPNGPWWASSS
jgi:hypothetical protein